MSDKENKLQDERLNNLEDSLNKIQSKDYDRLKNLEDTVNTIQNNHLRHLATDIIELKSDVKWIKKIGYFVVLQTMTIITGAVIIIAQHWIK